MPIFGTGNSMRFDCQLLVSASTILTLFGKGGLSLFIAGNNYSMEGSPAASSSGLSASTLYHVYAYWTGSVIELELSTTIHAVDTTYGHKIKESDPSRTYVGMIRTDASSSFVDSDAQRFCASYYNRINKPVQRTALTGNPNTASATFVELTAGDKVEFIALGEEWSNCYYSGCGLNATLGNVVGGGIAVNGTGTILAPNLFNAPVALYAMPISGNVGYKFAHGYNYINLAGHSSGGTVATFAGANCGFGAMLRQ